MGAVAKRTLRKSYYDKSYTDTLYNIWDIDNKNEKVVKVKKSKLKQKILIQSLTILTIGIIVFCIKYFDMESIKSSKFCKKILSEFKKDNSYSQIKEGFLNFSNKAYNVVSPIIPADIISYFNNEEIKNNSIDIYSEKDKEEKIIKIYEENNIEKNKNEGIGSSEVEEKVITALSSISTEDEIIQKIKDTKIEFIVPTKGVVSSSFGSREEIFEGIGTFHTGVDIAAEKGTDIVSSIKGTVTVADYNKYNGNYIEITNGKIVTIYCHMEKLLVKKGEKVKAGDKIGKMGSTGLSTGPHLHFEILYDGTKINPQRMISL